MDDALGGTEGASNLATWWAPSARVGAHMAAAVLPPDRAPIRVGAITLMPHQQEAEWLVRQSLGRWGGALLADPVGTGKTWVALAVAGAYPHVVVVAPAALRSRWMDAFAQAGRAGTFRSLEGLSRHDTDDLPRDALLVVDEAHHARNPGTRRFDALARLAWGRPVLLLTATPVHNRPRDLFALCSLFLGEAASRLPADMLARLVCRRVDVSPAGLPDVSPPRWLALDDDVGMLALLCDLPPPVPPSDGGRAGALGTLALLRQWASSESALLAALERRLTIGVAMESRLLQGGMLSRAELRQWIVEPGTVQLGLPLDHGALATELTTDLQHVRAHLEGLRTARDHLTRRRPLDRERLEHLRAIIDASRPSRVVCFTHSVDTARAIYRALSSSHRVALLAGAETRIASGPVSRHDILQQFAAGSGHAASRAMHLDVLVATDVMSEGVDLHDAMTLVHLDLPWTMARLQQRIGRLRRLGATHARVQHFAFAPPGGAGRFLRLLDRLARKGGLASRLVGEDPLSFAVPGRRTLITASPSDGAARLRSALRAWSLGCPATLDAGRGIPVALARGGHPVSQCLALVDLGDGPMLMLRTGSGMTTDAACIAHSMAGIVLDDHPRSPSPRDSRALQLNLRAVLAWCHRQVEQLELLGPERGAVQRRVLRRLHGLRDSQPRHVQRALTPHLARVTDVLLRSTGAGVERWLAAWLESHPAGTIDVACLGEVIEALAARARPGVVPPAVHVLGAILVVPERNAGPPKGSPASRGPHAPTA